MENMEYYSVFTVKGPGNGILFRGYFFYLPFKYLTLNKDDHDYFEDFLKTRKYNYEVKYGNIYECYKQMENEVNISNINNDVSENIVGIKEEDIEEPIRNKVKLEKRTKKGQIRKMKSIKKRIKKNATNNTDSFSQNSDE